MLAKSVVLVLVGLITSLFCGYMHRKSGTYITLVCFVISIILLLVDIGLLVSDLMR